MLVLSMLLSTAGCDSAVVPPPSTTAAGDPTPTPAAEQADAEPLTTLEGEHGRTEGEPKTHPAPPSDAGGQAEHTNQLINETSPYLLMHAHNPVDWHPWTAATLEKAKRGGKPIFLSIGYSSCYWCHVMERESFHDEEIAEFLNRHFICIKVDREERPDVDQIYMRALAVYNQIAGNGRGGGWPLSMFLTPEAKPFFGGTYFPARDGDRRGATGFLTVVKKMQEIWDQQREGVLQTADQLTEFTQQQLRLRRPVAVGPLDRAMVDVVWEDLYDDFDPKWGGFGYDPADPRRPKFPEPSNLLFLLDRVRRVDGDDRETALEVLTHTLDKMAQGGIYDHLGGGFHRYSVDRYWHIPHFEKMLYDNAQLASVYAEAYALTGDKEYELIVRGVLRFVQRELTDPAGGFYAALDAETDAEEGKFYRWEKEQLDRLLNEEDRALFGEIYQLNGEPNFEEKYYVPMLSQSLTVHAEERGMTLDELVEKLEPARKRLLGVRQTRRRPATDTKILTAWNGLMIRGFADAGRILDHPGYIETAEGAAGFVMQKLQADGRLLRTHTAGESKLNGYLDDYAFYIDGLIAIVRAGGPLKTKAQWSAQAWTDKQHELFWDKKAGGYFFTSSDHESLIARAKNPSDSALPAGNSVAAANLLFLADRLDKPEYRDRAKETIRASSVYLRTSPGAVPRLALALSSWLDQQADVEAPPSPATPPTE